MAVSQCVKLLSMPCGEDLDGDIYSALKFNSDAQLVKTTTALDVPVAILYEDPGTTVAGDHVTVMDLSGGGIGKVKAGAAGVTKAHLLVITSAHDDGTVSGKAKGTTGITGLAGDEFSFGIALEDAAAGAIFEFKPFFTTGQS